MQARRRGYHGSLPNRPRSSPPVPRRPGPRASSPLPTNARRPMRVRCFRVPSKLHVTAPAPMLTPSPTSTSPRYPKCPIRVLAPILEFFISAWLPICDPSPTTASCRICENGPTVTLLPSRECSTTDCRTTQPAPTAESTISVAGPIEQSAPYPGVPAQKRSRVDFPYPGPPAPCRRRRSFAGREP